LFEDVLGSVDDSDGYGYGLAESLGAAAQGAGRPSLLLKGVGGSHGG
jgi:hypothetical protein